MKVNNNSLIRKLYRMGFLSPFGIYYLLRACMIHGTNLMALLAFSAKQHGEQPTLNNKFTYQSAYDASLQLVQLFANQNITKKTPVAILCKNSTASVLSLFALSRLGANITLLNTDMSAQQINTIAEQQGFQHLLVDNQFAPLFDEKDLAFSIVYTNQIEERLSDCHKNEQQPPRIMPRRMGQLNILTGGTSGTIKVAKRSSGPSNLLGMLFPFFELIEHLALDKYKSVLIGVPMYHGYGLAGTIMSVALGAKMFIPKRFKGEESLAMIEQEAIEVLLLVPTTLQRLLDADRQATIHSQTKDRQSISDISPKTHRDKPLKSVKRILSGGARLDASVIQQTQSQIGHVLFNLYGTTEAGFCIIATPDDLKDHPTTIGKPIKGVRLTLHDQTHELLIKTAWSVSRKDYIATGDVGEIHDAGYVFLKGRMDNMIVSGGENVYPHDIEAVISQHPAVKQVAVIAVDDEEYDKRLVAFVVSVNDSSESITGKTITGTLTKAELTQWLKPQLARYQMPARLVMLSDMPMTSTGKVARKKLVVML